VCVCVCVCEWADKCVCIGEIECLKHDGESDTWVTRVKWGVGKSKGSVGLMGWDILVS